MKAIFRFVSFFWLIILAITTADDDEVTVLENNVKTMLRYRHRELRQTFFCRCVADYEDFYNTNRRELTENEYYQNNDGITSIDTSTNSKKYFRSSYRQYSRDEDAVIGSDGYYIVSGITVLPLTNEACIASQTNSALRAFLEVFYGPRATGSAKSFWSLFQRPQSQRNLAAWDERRKKAREKLRQQQNSVWKSDLSVGTQYESREIPRIFPCPNDPPVPESPAPSASPSLQVETEAPTTTVNPTYSMSPTITGAPTITAAPTQAINGTLAPTPAMNGTLAPTPVMNGTLAPTPTMNGTLAPTPTMNGTLAPTPTMNGSLAPTPTANATLAPTLVMNGTMAPTSTGNETSAPSSAVNGTLAPSSAVNGTRAPSPMNETMNETPTASPAGNNTQPPSPGGNNTQPPSPGGNNTQPQNPGGNNTQPQNPGGNNTQSQNPGGNNTQSQNPGGNNTQSQNPGGNNTQSQNPGGNNTQSQNPGGNNTQSQNPGGNNNQSQNPGGNNNQPQNPSGNDTRTDSTRVPTLQIIDTPTESPQPSSSYSPSDIPALQIINTEPSATPAISVAPTSSAAPTDTQSPTFVPQLQIIAVEPSVKSSFSPSASPTSSPAPTSGGATLLNEIPTAFPVLQIIPTDELTPADELTENVVCSRAESLQVGDTVIGTSSQSLVSFNLGCGSSSGIDNLSPVVWFQVIGTGEQLELDTCSSRTNFETAIQVAVGSCSNISCLSSAGSDTDNQCEYTNSSRIAWNSIRGQTYRILLFGRGIQVSGEYTLTLRSISTFG